MSNQILKKGILSRSFVGWGIILLILLQLACKKDWLNEKTDITLAVPSTLKDFQAIMDNANILMNTSSPALGAMGSDDHYITDASFTTRGNTERNAYIWSHLLPYTNVSDWASAYERIFSCNLVIEGVGKVPLGAALDLQAKNDIMGQALFQRAFTFFAVSQIWAPPYDSSSAATDLGIPLRTQSDINIPVTRSTLKQTYDQIINDLVEAKDLLPIIPVYKTRASKPAVFGLLARVYLCMGDYDKALNNSDSCLTLYNSLLDFNKLDSTASYPVKRLNNEVLFHKTLTNYTSIGSRALINDSLVQLYDTNDLRRSIYFLINADSTISFRGSYAGNVLVFEGIATDEIYLINAECYARRGNIASAMNDLNTLLSARWKSGTFVPFSATSGDDALALILKERKKELVMRSLRWSDLRRLNKDPRFQVTLTRIVSGNTYTLSPNNYRYTFPIPDDIIQTSGIPQNKGW